MPTYSDTMVLNDKVSSVFLKIYKAGRQLDRGLEKTQAKMAKLQKRFDNIKKVGQGMQQAGGKITATVTKITAGITALTAGLIFGLNKAADYADNIDKMSQKIGMSAEKYQELNFVLSQNGMNVNNLQMGYKTLTNQMASAQKGNKESISLFKKLNVSVKDTNGQLRSTDDVFDDAIKSLMKMKNPTERMALAIKLFGRNAQELAPLLNGGIESYEKLKKVAREKVGILSKEEIANAVKYKDTMDKFSKMFETRISALAIKYMPKVTEYLDKIMSNTELWDKVAVSLAKIISFVVKIVDWFVNLNGWQKKIVIGVGLLVAAIGPLLSGLGTILTILSSLGVALPALTASLGGFIATAATAAAPFLAIAAAAWAAIKAVEILIKKIIELKGKKLGADSLKMDDKALEYFSAEKSKMGAKAFNQKYDRSIQKAVSNYEKNDNRTTMTNSNNTTTNVTNNYYGSNPKEQNKDSLQYAT